MTSPTDFRNRTRSVRESARQHLLKLREARLAQRPARLPLGDAPVATVPVAPDPDPAEATSLDLDLVAAEVLPEAPPPLADDLPALEEHAAPEAVSEATPPSAEDLPNPDERAAPPAETAAKPPAKPPAKPRAKRKAATPVTVQAPLPAVGGEASPPEDPARAMTPPAPRAARSAVAPEDQSIRRAALAEMNDAAPPRPTLVAVPTPSALAASEIRATAEPASDQIPVSDAIAVGDMPPPAIVATAPDAPPPPAETEALPDPLAASPDTDLAEEEAPLPEDAPDVALSEPMPEADRPVPDAGAAPGPEPETPTEARGLAREGSGLEGLPGAGPGLLWMLGQCGIATLQDLAESDAAVLSQRLGLVGQILDVGLWRDYALQQVALARAAG